MRIEISDDLQSGRIFGGGLSDGDTVTLYGVRFEVGLDYGDGQGARLKRVEVDKFPHHVTVDDLDVGEMPIIQMTAGEYDNLAGGCLSDHVGESTTVSIHADNTYTTGEYDGNQYGESLI
jgi:hypothetical protein